MNTFEKYYLSIITFFIMCLNNAFAFSTFEKVFAASLVSGLIIIGAALFQLIIVGVIIKKFGVFGIIFIIVLTVMSVFRY